MTLDPKQFWIIEEQLQKENVDEFITSLLLQYSTDINRTSYLLSLIPQIAEAQLKITQNRVTEFSNATNMLMSVTNQKMNIDFPTLLFTCKVYFPNGNCEGASISGEHFFKKFIDAIKDKKGFDYESEVDWSWIKNVVDCEAWMISVIRQNVDENFRG